MSQFRDQGFQQTSPSSYTGVGIDVGNIGSTPNSRTIGYSPGSNSVKSASKPNQTPDRDGSDGQHSIFSPTVQGSGGGFRTTGIPVDRDPFVTPSSKTKTHGQRLSATASSFRPFYDEPSDGSESNRSRAGDDFDNERNQAADNISPALSTELMLSRCIELSASTSVTSADAEAYLAIIAPGENIAANHEGQLDLLAVLLHNAPMGLPQVEPVVFKLLRSEGDLFAFRKHHRSEDGALKAVIEYSDINVALNVAGKLNGITVDGLHLRIDFYQAEGHAGRAVPLNEGITTPMPTPMRYPPDENMGFQTQAMGSFHKPQQPGNNGLLPVRHQVTPPASGMGGPPQVALVPMVLRNPYTPGTPLILDPYGPHGHNMTPMPGGTPLVFPPGAPVSTIMGHHGYDRSSTVASRYNNRRGGALRIDRNLHYNPNGHHNQVDINRIREGVDVRTTIMLRNIPNKVDQRMLKAIVDESSWGKYDFMYLRIDFANDCNVGYAFINFADPLDIIDFAKARDNQRCDKVAEISYASRDCLVQKFRNSSVMLEAPHYRPKLYYTVNGTNPDMAGQEEEFPGPDNPSKMKRSCENAEHVGLFTPHLSQYYRDEQRRRRSQYDRGTRMAALEEYDYEATLQRMYMPH
ncbi:meiosis protein [Grosmannia clavigera kw1407]|uniref:Meiosis protein n=1 Tax=Grosmannia clavigera (strain kw1407 / UAMH 11150) TaxID=655863 RepID=F0XQ03_GROCL|nr:meiosis protein [Grosmannia clavigera kw1407]EFX00571.1 meiosis protein [Grosmannia clavigera kw1407]